MDKLLLYAHYSARASIDSYVFHTLKHFRALGYEVVVASTSEVRDQAALARLAQLGCELQLVPNIGYDFYAWRSALLDRRAALNKLQSLVLLNSSVHGPFFSLSEFLDCCMSHGADVVGATLSREPKPHLQSYFFHFKPRVFRSEAFLHYWETLKPYADRQSTIDHHELGFSDYLPTCGFSLAAFHTAHDSLNPALKHPYLLMRKRLPFLKLRKLRKARHLLLQMRLRTRALLLKPGR